MLLHTWVGPNLGLRRRPLSSSASLFTYLLCLETVIRSLWVTVGRMSSPSASWTLSLSHLKIFVMVVCLLLHHPEGKQMANAHVAAVQSLANTLSKCQFVADTVTGQRPHLSSSSPAGPLKRKLRICLPFAHTRRAVVGRHWVLQGPPHGQLGLRQDLPQQTCHH